MRPRLPRDRCVHAQPARARRHSASETQPEAKSAQNITHRPPLFPQAHGPPLEHPGIAQQRHKADQGQSKQRPRQITMKRACRQSGAERATGRPPNESPVKPRSKQCASEKNDREVNQQRANRPHGARRIKRRFPPRRQEQFELRPLLPRSLESFSLGRAQPAKRASLVLCRLRCPPRPRRSARPTALVSAGFIRPL